MTCVQHVLISKEQFEDLMQLHTIILTRCKFFRNSFVDKNEKHSDKL